MALFLPISCLAILFAHSFTSFNVNLLLSIIVAKSFFSLILSFLKLNLFCIHLGIDRSDVCFPSDFFLSTFDGS